MRSLIVYADHMTAINMVLLLCSIWILNPNVGKRFFSSQKLFKLALGPPSFLNNGYLVEVVSKHISCKNTIIYVYCKELTFPPAVRKSYTFDRYFYKDRHVDGL